VTAAADPPAPGTRADQGYIVLAAEVTGNSVETPADRIRRSLEFIPVIVLRSEVPVTWATEE